MRKGNLRVSPLDSATLVVYTLCSASGLLLMRAGLGQARLDWLNGGVIGWPAALASVGIAFYVASFLLWLVILTRNPVSIAYPVAIGLTLIFVGLGAKLLLGEILSPARLGGMALILGGIILVTQS